MPSVLVVCTGNQCRSPLAAAILRVRLDAAGAGTGWAVASAGTWAEAGLPAAEFARQAAEGMGLSLQGHRSRRVLKEILEGQDLILVMERGHAEALRAEFPWVTGRVHLLAGLAGEAYDIPDPFGGTLEAYRALARDLDSLVEKALPKILELGKTRPAEGPLA